MDGYYYEDYGVSNKYGFSLNGEYKDSSGIIHLRKRAYLPKYAMFLQLDDYTGSLESIISQNRRTFANNNPYRFYDKTGNNAEEVRTTAQANQNQTGYDIDYVKAQVVEDYNQSEGEPIMPLDGGTLPWDWDWGWGITLLVDVVNYLIKTGKLSLREAIRMFMTGVLVIICAQGLSATVNTYEKQQEQEAKVSQSSVGSNAGTIDTPSNNYNKGLDEALRDLGKQLQGMAGAAIFGVLLGLIISEIKRYVTKDTFNAK